MDDFEVYIIKLSVAITFITIIFIFFSLYYSRKQSEGQWPPETQQCPDYWRINEGAINPITNRKSMYCYDDKGLTDNQEWKNTGIDIDTMAVSEWKTLCDKQRWAKRYNLTWDTVTNSNKDCTYTGDTFVLGEGGGPGNAWERLLGGT